MTTDYVSFSIRNVSLHGAREELGQHSRQVLVYQMNLPMLGDYSCICTTVTII